jgi:hypothetical protein
MNKSEVGSRKSLVVGLKSKSKKINAKAQRTQRTQRKLELEVGASLVDRDTVRPELVEG